MNYYNDIPGVTPMPGNRQYQPYLTAYDSFIFYNAIGEYPDYFYRPIAMTKQVVSETNYRFITTAEPEWSDLTLCFAIMGVYQPLEGRAHAARITSV